jgi:broad specificity phosphatase PhoE
MLRIVLVRPGATDYDCDERIQGVLDIPMNQQGTMEIARAVEKLRELRIETIYAAPCESARQTADILSKDLDARVKKLDRMQNLNLGLWQGMKVGEVRRNQPKVYRQWQEQPENVCPPDGEMIEQAEQRIRAALTKVVRRHKDGVICLVLPEPLASIVRRAVSREWRIGKHDDLGDLWKALAGHGRWEVLDPEPAHVPVLNS